MHFGSAIGTACSSFAITNIDDIFVLVTFMAEASSTSKVMTPWNIVIGQYMGFTVIIVISMIGFGVSLGLPSEPIGFLGFLPILLGIWSMLDWAIPSGDDGDGDGDNDDNDDNDDDDGNGNRQHVSRIASSRGVFKVALVTLMNGGDNIGTYIPLFSQTRDAEIAVYIAVYYVLVGVWCLAAFLIMKQKHVLRAAEKYAHVVVPILYVGLGIFIIAKSECYPWSMERIDRSRGGHLGRTILVVVTTGLLVVCVGVMAWCKWRWRKGGGGHTGVTGQSSAHDTTDTRSSEIALEQVIQQSSLHDTLGGREQEKAVVTLHQRSVEQISPEPQDRQGGGPASHDVSKPLA